MALLHLKLDRLLGNVDAVQVGVTENDASIRALTAGLDHLQNGIGTLTEMVAKLAEAMSKEADGMEMRSLIEKIEASLIQLREDSTRTVTMLTRLPPTLQRAAEEGIRLAMGEAVDIPPAAGA